MKDENGKPRSFDYNWDEEDNSGYSFLGNTFHGYCAEIFTGYNEPTFSELKKYNVYIITDPDIPVENPNPKYMTEKDADAIYQWVKAGGTLVIMANDSGNADIVHTNILAKKFGFIFNNISVNHAPGKIFDSGAIYVTEDNPVFHRVSFFLRLTKPNI